MSPSAVHLRRVATVLSVSLMLATACSSTKSHTEAPGTSSSTPPTTASTPPTPTTKVTTTTTGPLTAAHVPLSATFVSPRTGWALEGNKPFCGAPDPCTYAIAKTTDGGDSWSALAAFPLPLGYNPRIRFADDLHGFVYDGASIAQTDDGGLRWSRLALPFHQVQALEIERGIVWVVAGGTSNTDVDFHIWSAPAARIEWAMDPLPVPVGAGPVPAQQFVFAHGAGWMVNLDRTVIGGARLAGPRWIAWTPPCATLAGPVALSASTATDLVADCNEHAYNGVPTNAVYFSHDGGRTFSRRAAPAYGFVGSPNPTTAVIATGAGVWRTSDSGATWRQVLHISEADGRTVTELGFTTSTQGFVTEGAGGMLMTRDAGATWNRVALP